MDITVIERVVPAMSVETRTLRRQTEKVRQPVIVDVSTEIGVTQWIKSLPKLIQEKLLRIIHSSARPDVVQEIVANEKRFKPWRSMTIGGVSRLGFLRKLQIESKSEKNGGKETIWISWWARAALMRPSVKTSRKQRRIRLLVLSADELGLDERSTFNDLAEAISPKRLATWSAENLYGWCLSLCPVETGLHLRFRYRQQPEDESILVASKPIMFEDESTAMFAVERDKNDNPSLQVMHTKPEELNKRLPLGMRIAFELRRHRAKKHSARITNGPSKNAHNDHNPVKEFANDSTT